jgi:hypothetical protein
MLDLSAKEVATLENVMTIAILLIVVAVAVFLNVVATWKVRQSSGLTRSQKTAQTILAWILPFFGAIAVIVISTDPAERQRRRTRVESGADGGGYFGGDGGGHHGSHGHGHGGDAGHGGDGGGHGGDGGGGH